MNQLKQAVLQEVWQDTALLVYDTVHRFRRRYRQRCLNDLKSVAHEAWVEAVLSYDPSKAALTTHVRFRVWHSLMDDLKRRIKYYGRFEVTDMARLRDGGRKAPCAPLADSLSNDARIALALALAYARDGNAYHARRRLRAFLRDWGWSGERIDSAFTEIKTALE